MKNSITWELEFDQRVDFDLRKFWSSWKSILNSQFSILSRVLRKKRPANKCYKDEVLIVYLGVTFFEGNQVG